MIFDWTKLLQMTIKLYQKLFSLISFDKSFVINSFETDLPF